MKQCGLGGSKRGLGVERSAWALPLLLSHLRNRRERLLCPCRGVTERPDGALVPRDPEPTVDQQPPAAERGWERLSIEVVDELDSPADQTIIPNGSSVPSDSVAIEASF